MKTGRVTRWAQIWDWVCAWWKVPRPRKDGDESQRALPLTPTQKKQENRTGSDKEYVSKMQRKIGLSPTEGHELIQDLHVAKCRSQGLGAPQSTTGFRHHPIQISLSRVSDELADESPVEEIREMGRSLIRDIRARIEQR